MNQVPFQRVEIEINTACDMKCFGCDRFVDVSAAPPMTLEQIEYFVEESLATNWLWKRIHILGGEPTIHPKFKQVVEILLKYKSESPTSLLRVISNGHGNLEKHRKWLVSNKVSIHVEGKRKAQNPEWFRNTRITPFDEDPSSCPKPPCSIYGMLDGGCGLGLTRYGYFLCGAGASVARMTNQDIGIKKITDLTHEAMIKQAVTICHICGHWNANEGPLRENMLRDTGPTTGKFWTQAIESHRNNPSTLTLYGAN